MKGEVACEIDGAPVSAETMGVFEQRDPYPGGHSYRIVLTGRPVRRLFRDFANRTMDQAAILEATSSILFFLTAALLNLKGSEGKEKFVVNTVSVISFADEEVELEGICSEIIGSKRA